MEVSSPDRRAARPAWLAPVAFAWSAVLVAWVFAVPAYGGRAHDTLWAHDGGTALIPIALPAALTLIAWIALVAHRRGGDRRAWRVAVGAVGLLVAYNLLEMFAIGVLLLPMSGLLVWAVWPLPGSRSPRPA
jgi:hypothetical protein